MYTRFIKVFIFLFGYSKSNEDNSTSAMSSSTVFDDIEECASEKQSPINIPRTGEISGTN